MASLGVSGIVRITSNAEARKSTNGTYYNFGIAAFRKYVPKGKQDVDFFNATLYSKEPSAALQSSLSKGQLIYISGADLLNERFTGADGKEKNMVKIRIIAYELFNPGDKAREAKESAVEPPKYTPEKTEEPKVAPVKKAAVPVPVIQIEEEEDPNDDEVPF